MLEPIVIQEVMKDAIEKNDIETVYKCTELLNKYDKKFTNRKETTKQLKKVRINNENKNN